MKIKIIMKLPKKEIVGEMVNSLVSKIGEIFLKLDFSNIHIPCFFCYSFIKLFF